MSPPEDELNALSSPSVAVVIPTIGRLSLIEALESVLQQTWRPAEVVVVSSAPNPLDPSVLVAVEGISTATAMHVLRLPPGSGASIARNVGAWAATSEFVAFLDDDDRYESRFLAQALERAMTGSFEFVYGAKIHASPEQDAHLSNRDIGSVPRDQWLTALYRRENPGFGGQNLVARRTSSIAIGGFPPDFLTENDTAFAMRLLTTDARVAYEPRARVEVRTGAADQLTRRPGRWIDYLRLVLIHWSRVGWRHRVRGLRRAFWYFLEDLDRARRDSSSAATGM